MYKCAFLFSSPPLEKKQNMAASIAKAFPYFPPVSLTFLHEHNILLSQQNCKLKLSILGILVCETKRQEA